MDTVREARYSEALGRLTECVTWHLRSHTCTTCGVIFQPAGHHGLRRCAVHPRASSGQSITADEVLDGGGGPRASLNHYLCCGWSVPGRTQTDRIHLPPVGVKGCTRADHIAHDGWRYLYPSSLRRHVNVRFHSQFAEDITEARAAAWFHMFPSSILPLIGREFGEFVSSTGALYFSKISDILEPWGGAKIAIYTAGGYEFRLDMKEAYLTLLNTFALPLDALQHTEARGHGENILGTDIKEEFEGASDLLETLRIAIPGAPTAASAGPKRDAEDQLTSAMRATRRLAFGSSHATTEPIASQWSFPGSVARPRVLTQGHSDRALNDHAWRTMQEELWQSLARPRHAFYPFFIFPWMAPVPDIVL